MEIPNNQITHSLRSLGYDKTLGTGLSGKEYRYLVGALSFKKQPTPTQITDEVKRAVRGITTEDFLKRSRLATNIRLIKRSLTVVAKDLGVSVSLSKSDYPEVIKMIEGMTGKVTPELLAPKLAEYIFGEE